MRLINSVAYLWFFNKVAVIFFFLTRKSSKLNNINVYSGAIEKILRNPFRDGSFAGSDGIDSCLQNSLNVEPGAQLTCLAMQLTDWRQQRQIFIHYFLSILSAYQKHNLLIKIQEQKLRLSQFRIEWIF